MIYSFAPIDVQRITFIRKGAAMKDISLKTLGKDTRIFASAKLGAIGPRTAEKLAEYSINADFVPTKFTSKEFAIQVEDNLPPLHADRVRLNH